MDLARPTQLVQRFKQLVFQLAKLLAFFHRQMIINLSALLVLAPVAVYYQIGVLAAPSG